MDEHEYQSAALVNQSCSVEELICYYSQLGYSGPQILAFMCDVHGYTMR